jgi:hypothetical protein
MNENLSPGNPMGIPPQIDFITRAPSQTWEAIVFPDSPQFCAWGWFKPVHTPQGIILQIPDETIQGYPNISQLKMRGLVQLAGVNPSMVTGWYFNGVQYDAQGGNSPLFDQPVPLPVAGTDPNILVYTNLPVTGQPVVPPQEQFSVATSHGQLNLDEMFKKIEIDWKESLAVVRKLSMKRKELVDMVAKLKSFNRELNIDENRFSTQEDKGEWRDARRLLRDISTKLDMYIKQHDIGVTSFAGKREWFEETYNQYIQPRQAFDDIVQAERDFEHYRKTLQVLMSRMNTSQVQAGRDGERRARQVLSKIAAKVQAGRTKRFDH